MKLLYQGYTYNCSGSANRKALPPRAVNWRYNLPGATGSEATVVRHYSQPQAINWRYQVPEMF